MNPVAWLVWTVISALAGGFVGAYGFEKVGRDPRHGGMLGLIATLCFGTWALVLLAAWAGLSRRVDREPPGVRWWAWWRGTDGSEGAGPPPED